MCSEAYCCQALGIDYEIVVACDQKWDVWQLLKSGEFVGRPQHFYSDVSSLLRFMEGQGPRPQCLACSEKSIDCSWEPPNPYTPDDDLIDVLVAGFPCQPFSGTRNDRYGEADTVRCHPKFYLGQA
eukprot:9162826-Pyramimonas_sp.AAC.1